jgi:tetratricopeptide (TPR) repeat protein
MSCKKDTSFIAFSDDYGVKNATNIFRELSTRAIFAALALAFLCATLPAQAELRREQRRCGAEGLKPAQRVEACNRLIASGLVRGDDLVDALIDRGTAFGQTKKFDRAIADLNHAIKLKPDFAPSYAARASIQMDRGEIDAAGIDIDRAFQIDPKLAEAYRLRGEIARRQGRIEAALNDFEKAIKLGGPPMVKDFQSRLHFWQLYQGPVTGVYDKSTRVALVRCVEVQRC